MFNANVPVWVFYALSGYLITFMVVTGALYLWRTSQKRARPPEKFKLLRGPGELQRRRVQQADENLYLYLLSGAFVPLVVAGVVLMIAIHLPRSFVLLGAGIATAAFIASMICGGMLLFRFLNRRRNDLLGYLVSVPSLSMARSHCRPKVGIASFTIYPVRDARRISTLITSWLAKPELLRSK